MTNEDQLFLSTVDRVLQNNLTNPDKQQIIRTTRALLSAQMITTMGIDINAMGGWFMGVYVELIPMYSTPPANAWQSQRPKA